MEGVLVNHIICHVLNYVNVKHLRKCVTTKTLVKSMLKIATQMIRVIRMRNKHNAGNPMEINSNINIIHTTISFVTEILMLYTE